MSFLEVSRIEARGAEALSLEAVHLANGLASAIDLVQPLAAERRIRIEKQLPEDYDRHVIADEQRLKQVLLNLLSNAVKYNRPGGSVTVAVEESTPTASPCWSRTRGTGSLRTCWSGCSIPSTGLAPSKAPPRAPDSG